MTHLLRETGEKIWNLLEQGKTIYFLFTYRVSIKRRPNAKIFKVR